MVRPSTCTTSSSRSALLPSSRTTLPLTVTFPSSMSASALRLEVIPARAMIFCRRSRAIGWVLGGIENCAAALRRVVGPRHRGLQRGERGVGLDGGFGDALLHGRIARQLGE